MKPAILVASVILLATFLLAPPAAATTLDNLQAAYNGESNAHAKYLEYAKKADAEGFKGAASLFRAAAAAEKVHADMHAVVIKDLGAKPTKKIELPTIGTTAENIADAVKGESYERDVMYPKFIEEATAEKSPDALRAFKWAKTAEAEHANLYTNAGKNLDEMKAAKTFYVCEVCGYTTTNLDFQKCVSCLTPREKYKKVA